MATRLIIRRKSSPAESSWVFRGFCFTLLLFFPLLIIGWSSPAVAQTIPTWSVDNGPQVSEPAEDLQFVGSIAGAFVIEAAVRSRTSVKMAIVMFHVNLIMGTLFAGIASALAPWMGCKTIAVV
ncbi:hypothetical protein LMH87_009689 [Akanthomyces muscarius]|uniref:Ammonium transporter n=1 Tax=Akanthomyces muscarius TaxID=2231603 RepID=A0A9W8UJS6_AKAMU|nr:hypothetical protein LMH87_009689 [Akanthomyces muscarius]KAJ4153189.1 hypothetical protein LMH87_009689 [Akanthomyces muscarius]